MQTVEIRKEDLTKGAFLQNAEKDAIELSLSKEGAGFCLPQLLDCRERFLCFQEKVLEEHSLAMELRVYVHGEKEPAFTVRFGLLPGVETNICIDLQWMDARQLFPKALPGALKVVCHGRRVEKEEIERIVLASMPAFHDVRIRIQDPVLTDRRPQDPPLPEIKLVDRFGQNKKKEWPGKIKSVDELKKALLAQAAESGSAYPFPDWTAYGGWKQKKLTEGTGFFSKCKENGRWWLTDPLGYAFFSMGPDCVGPGSDCRIAGVEKWLDRMPERFVDSRNSFFQENLYRAFGENWYEDWRGMMAGQLKKNGMNTLGNWSDPQILGTTDIPYVTSLPEFPATKQCIFRDFPDVFSDEYRIQAKRCAAALAERKNDPLMIGYFLRNEPAWAFVDNLVLADEVLYQPERTACKEELIAFLKERYPDIEALNRAWNGSFESFEDLYRPLGNASKRSKAACRDMKEFSGRMLRAYVGIPARECRKADPNHMILGMRWAWISDPDLVAGWENFDVFSINCYAQDPTEKIQQVADLGVDLPVMIGEFHFGALDAGLPATGLEAVVSQKDRGVAYRYYCESVAAHPYGVGCHYFQCYDQFMLGRFDGENYNIGLFDICSIAYPEMMEQIRKCSGRVYEIADGRIQKTAQRAEAIPMIAY